MDSNKCSICKKGDAVVCHACYNNLFFSYLYENMKGDMVNRIKFEIMDDMEDKLSGIQQELNLIKDYLKINKIKRYIKEKKG